MQDVSNPSKMTTKLDHALRLILEDVYIFPLLPNAKTPPAGMEWRKQSTKNKETIKEWFKLNSDYNIAIDTGKSSLLVIDVDVAKGKAGEEGFALLDMTYGFPPTFTVETQSGGKHYYYKSTTDYANTTNKLHNGIDTRGDGGYVVAPGSSINGNSYRILKNLMIPDAPEWLGEKLKESKVSHASEKKKEILSNDNPEDITRAKHWLISTAEHAVEGAGGDHTTFATAARLREFGLSKDTTLELLLDHWNDECSPPWNLEELQIKVDNAYKYAQKPQGSDSIPTEFTPVVIPPRPNLWLPQHNDTVFGNIPQREWVFGNIALKKKISLLVAPPGMGKSTWTILVALSKASGRDIAGFDPKGAGVAAIHNQEDDLDEINRRLEAAMLQHHLNKQDIKDGVSTRLLIGSGDQKMFKIAKKNQNGLLAPSDMQSFTERLIETNTQLLIVDPFSETHDGEENSNVDVLQVGTMYRQMAQKANCAIILAHHSRKPDGASSEGFAGNMNSSRGASSLLGVARIVITLDAMSDKDTKTYGIDPEAKHHYIRLDTAKANMTLSNGKPIWYQKHQQLLGVTQSDPDGEPVGTLAAIELRNNLYAADSPIFAFICDMEMVLQSYGPRLPVAEVIKVLLNEYPDYANSKANTLNQRIRRLFKTDTLPASKGDLILEQDTGETVGHAKIFITWKPL